MDMLNQGKVSRGVSYSPKISTTSVKPSTNIENSKWSRVRNAFLSKDESITLEESMSMPSSPTRKSATFFTDEDTKPPIKTGDEKDSSG